MQKPKPRSVSSEIPQRTSPVTPRTHASKIGDNDSNSPATSTRTSTDRSPKVIVRQSFRSPATEKKHATRLSELETQINQLQEDLKKTREQLSSSETCKKRVQQEAEEAKKKLQDMSTKLDDSQRQLVEFSATGEARLQELWKISQERDRAWQSELEAIQKQHSIDSASLSSSMNEIHRMKVQLEIVLKSEATQLKQSEVTRTEIQALKHEMVETLSTVENLKLQLRDSKKLEAEAHMLVDETQGQLERAKTTIETLRSKGFKLKENSNANDLGEEICCGKLSGKTRKGCVEPEVEELRYTLEALEITYEADQIQRTKQIWSAYELLERVKGECGIKEDELELQLNQAIVEVNELKAKLMENEVEFKMIADNNNKELKTNNGEVQKAQMQSELELNLMKSINDMADLKASLMDKETELQNFLEENWTLKSEMEKRQLDCRKGYEVVNAELELARAAEQDALIRLGYASEEADKNSRRAARVAEQLDAARALNSETESELKRLRIQCDQWRKAAEAAAGMLSSGNNEQHRTRTGSLDSNYGSAAGRLMSSPISDYLEEESPKKRNANMLRKIGGLWKKNPK